MKDNNQLLQHFDTFGYVVMRGLLDWERDLQPVIDEYTDLLDGLARRWFAEKKISSSFEGMALLDRWSRLAPELEETVPGHRSHFEITFLDNPVRADCRIHLGPAVFNLLRSARLLDGVELLIGPEIYSTPIQHVRLVRPGSVDGTAFHQDLSVVTPEADDTDMLSVWLPLTEVTPESCLYVVPGSHKRELLHCLNRDDTEFPHRMIEEEQIPLPMCPGDVLFFHKGTIHGAPPNTGDSTRFSFDLRYNPIEQAPVRPFFPGFVARSRSHPESELRDAETWIEMWEETRARLARVGKQQVYRGDVVAGADPLCA